MRLNYPSFLPLITTLIVPHVLLKLIPFFNFIEVTVVIAIIAILAGMLLPALNKAREKARAASCMSNMKQISTGIMMYVDDNQGMLPVYAWNSNEMMLIMPYVGATNAWGSQGSALWQPKNKTLFLCPSASMSLSGIENYASIYTPYAHPNESWMGNHLSNRNMWVSEQCGDPAGYSARLESMSSDAPLFGESYYVSFSSTGITWPIQVNWTHKQVEDGSANPSFRHSERTNYVRNDGSADSIKYTGQQLFDNVTGSTNVE